jgi:Ca-activated chloride channel homolog
MVRASWIGVMLLAVATAIISGCGEESAPSAAPAATQAQRPDDLGGSRYAGAIAAREALPGPAASLPQEGMGPGAGGDKYAWIEESRFLAVKDAPLSTFSIDVDTASYAKTRAYLLEHHALPPPDAVRIEELVNYFDYAYAGPTDEHPFAVHIETAQCPWQPQHRLVRFGIQGKRIDRERSVSNLVFLIDVSGSMDRPNRLPLVQRSLSQLVRQLGENDRVAIVVYAGAAGLVLPPTSGSDQEAILGALGRLRAGGSTNGGAGIHLAYQLAQDNFVAGGVNRVLLCTDGDFNVGTTSTGDLVRLAETKAKGGVYLSVLGFGFGNHNDAMLEQLANRANGNYAFIDSDREAHKVLVEQMQGTLVTIAKDVKLQVEFNPAHASAYRLIGYENRRLADRDFNDDTKDAGDIGAGHSVTALYEVVPVAAESDLGRPEVDPLRYQEAGVRSQGPEAIAGELLTLKLRYQPPTGGVSTLMAFPAKDSGASFGSASADLQFAAAVASFGMLLRNSRYKGDASYAAVLETASATRGADRHGRRSEFLEIVQAAQRLSGERIGAAPSPWQRRVESVAGGQVRSVPIVPAWGATRRRPAFYPLYAFKPEQVFGLGLAVGGLIAVAATLACALVVVFRGRRRVSYANGAGTKFGPGYWHKNACP